MYYVWDVMINSNNGENSEHKEWLTKSVLHKRQKESQAYKLSMFQHNFDTTPYVLSHIFITW